MGYYQESGKVNWGLTFLSVFPLFIFIGIVAYGYAFLTVINPFIYLNFIGTIIYVGVIGFLLNLVKHWGRIRNSTVLYVVGSILAIFGLYVVWVSFMSISLDRSLGYSFTHFYKGIDVLSNRVIGVGRRGGSLEISGTFLIILWVIEASILVIGPLLFVHSGLKEMFVFCEDCNKWMNKHEIHFKKSNVLLTQNGLVDAVNQNKLQAILDMEDAKPGVGSYYELKFTSCATCNVAPYLSVKSVSHTLNDKDKLERNERSILPYYTKEY